METPALNLKILVVGDSGVGKTCFIYRFCDDKFYPNYVSTVGCDFKASSIEVDGRRINLKIWDTAGQERFRTLTSTYYRGASGIILMYDVTNEASFNNVICWLENIAHNASKEVCKLLVGNKCDKDGREVDYKRGKTLASAYEMQFEEVSAKNNLNLENVFQLLCKNIVDQKLSHQHDLEQAFKENKIELSTKSKMSKWCGC